MRHGAARSHGHSSPTGKAAIRQVENLRYFGSSRCGFTLVELLLVMTLLVVVLAVAAPSLGNFFRGRSLDSEARRLLALTRHGQSRAVSEGVPMVLWLNEKERTYGLEEEAGFTDLDEKAVTFTLEKDLEMEVVNPAFNSTNRANVNTIAPTTLNMTTTGNPHGNLPAIRCLPDGSFGETSPQAVRLIGRDEEAIWLAQARSRLNYEIRNQTNQWDELTP